MWAVTNAEEEDLRPLLMEQGEPFAGPGRSQGTPFDDKQGDARGGAADSVNWGQRGRKIVQQKEKMSQTR